MGQSPQVDPAQRGIGPQGPTGKFSN
jgi:hypothetical protein